MFKPTEPSLAFFTSVLLFETVAPILPKRAEDKDFRF